MLYKNSLKILFSNFHVVWKSILYFLLTTLLCWFLIYLCVTPVYKLLLSNNVINEAINIYSDFMASLNFSQLGSSIGELIELFFEVIIDNISKIWINFLGIAIITLFLSVFLNNLTIMPFCNSLHYYMGSMNRLGFYSSFFDVLGKNLKVQTVYYIISWPIKIINCLAIMLIFRLFTISWIWSILGIFILVLSWVILLAFKFTLFSSWIPTMVIMNYGVFKSLKISVKNMFRQFPRVFGNAVGVVLTLLCVYMLGIFTFFVALALIIPASYLFYSAFGMVSTYESQGMRYYVDIYNVITPKKKEIGDKLSEMKYIV